MLHTTNWMTYALWMVDMRNQGEAGYLEFITGHLQSFAGSAAEFLMEMHAF